LVRAADMLVPAQSALVGFALTQISLLSLGPAHSVWSAQARGVCHASRLGSRGALRAGRAPSTLRPTLARRAAPSGVADTSADALALQAFLEREGFEFNRLQLAFFGDLRGMMAKEFISPGDTLLAFPSQSTLSLASTRKCPCSELVGADFWEETESWTLKMALWLVAEHIKGDASRFAEYLAVLPPVSGSVLTWETSQLAQLGYAPLETQVLATRAEMRQAIEQCGAHLKCSTEIAVKVSRVPNLSDYRRHNS
jgi:hypothetical protein